MAETDNGAELVLYALEVFRDIHLPRDQRWEALEWLANRGLGRPIAMVELAAHVMAETSSPDTARLRPLTDAQLELLATLDQHDANAQDVIDVAADEPLALEAP